MTKYIFESPDHGKTVYRREIGSNDRHLYSTDSDAQDQQLWGKIHSAGKHDPVLQELLEQVKIYYKLKYL